MTNERICGNCDATDELVRMDDPVMPTPKAWLCESCIDDVTQRVREMDV